MAYIPTYAKRKNGQEAVTFIDPRLEPITGVTHATCIYQDQYLEIAKQIAGFSPAEADDLRKAIGKKIHELMASLKDKFLEGCAQSGTTPQVANQLWKDMESSQDYSFNKSHAACYALIAYRTAWLRAHHPREYMAALISSVMNTKDRVPFYVAACAEMGIAGQGSIFDLGDEVETAPKHHPEIPTYEFEKNELLRLEKETLGLYVSEHPLNAVRDQLRRKTDAALAELERRRDGEIVTVGGIVSAIKQVTTKKGEPMVFVRLDDVIGSAECVVFNSVYAASHELLVPDAILVVKARIDHKEGETKLIAIEVSSFEATPERREVLLRIGAVRG